MTAIGGSKIFYLFWEIVASGVNLYFSSIGSGMSERKFPRLSRRIAPGHLNRFAALFASRIKSWEMIGCHICAVLRIHTIASVGLILKQGYKVFWFSRN